MLTLSNLDSSEGAMLMLSISRLSCEFDLKKFEDGTRNSHANDSLAFSLLSEDLLIRLETLELSLSSGDTSGFLKDLLVLN